MQRDMYSYVRPDPPVDEPGYVGAEIAEMLGTAGMEAAWHTTVLRLDHNVKAIYQRYMGWYDANPAHL